MNEEIAKGGDIRSTGSLELSSDISTITAEINAYQRIAGEAIFEIGRRLKHVKETLMKEKHGEWTEWLREVGIEASQARRFIKVAEEFEGKRGTYHGLGLRALYEIATLPPEQRDQTHITANGEEKKPEEMTVRELRELKKQLRAEKAERERLERENEELAKEAGKPPEVVTEYVEVKDEEAERKVQRYEELFGDVSIYEGRTTRITNGDAITYAVFEFSEDVRKFIEKYGHLTHFVNEFNGMIGEGKEEYQKAIDSMARFLGEIERNLYEEEAIIING